MYSEKERQMFLKLGYNDTDLERVDPYVLYRMAVSNAFLNKKRGPAARSLRLAGYWLLERNADRDKIDGYITLDFSHTPGAIWENSKVVAVPLQEFPIEDIKVGLKLRNSKEVIATIFKITDEDHPYWIQYEDVLDRDGKSLRGHQNAIDEDFYGWYVVIEE